MGKKEFMQKCGKGNKKNKFPGKAISAMFGASMPIADIADCAVKYVKFDNGKEWKEAI